jgi:predicted metalloprotease with PDZ domain
MSAQDEAAYKKLVAEAGALFGARHYSEYHFLLTLSDQVGGRGLEHHQSSDNGLEGDALTDPDLHLLGTGLLPHEFTHSWNGKYRRPIGLATKNYQEPMKGDLLWVYEGLTEYLGDVLAVRSGLRTPEQYRESLSETAADLDHEPGRTWRPLQDTARSVQVIRQGGTAWSNWRRGLDYYPESELIWLDVDTTIRQQSHGQKSLDDFCRSFYGGQTGPPKVVPYTFEDVVSTLNQVSPYDWAKFLNDRIKPPTAHPPMGGIEHGGWRLAYNDQSNMFVHAIDKVEKGTNAIYSLGLLIGKEGKIADVIYDSPAYAAGMGPGMQLMAVNGRKYSGEVLATALKNSKNSSQPIELLVLNADFYKTYSVNYHDGLKQPHLVRAEGPDLIGDILKPLTK